MFRCNAEPGLPLQLQETGFRKFDEPSKTTDEFTVQPDNEEIPVYGESTSYERANRTYEDEDDSLEINYDRAGLPNAEEDKEAEKIIKSVSSINDKKTEGLSLLLPEKEETKEKELAEDVKKIV